MKRKTEKHTNARLFTMKLHQFHWDCIENAKRALELNNLSIDSIPYAQVIETLLNMGMKVFSKIYEKQLKEIGFDYEKEKEKITKRIISY
jgi:hypothetical protein